MFHTVALLSPPFSSLTYSRPEWLESFAWRPGLRVLVPLGNGMTRVGVILDAGRPQSGLAAGVNARPMLWPLEAVPLLPPEHLEMVRQLAARQMITPGRILGSVLPLGLRSSGGRLRCFTPQGGTELCLLRDLPRKNVEDLKRLGHAWVEGRGEVLSPKEDAASSESCVLLREPPWSVRPTAVRQLQILEYLLEHGAVSRRALLQLLGQAVAPALASLIRNGLVAVRRGEQTEDVAQVLLPPSEICDFALSEDQRAALDLLTASLDSGEPSTRLLFGVTGSGKTAVYLELIRACLERGRSAFLLAPEVALAFKLFRDAERALPGAPCCFFHGYQSAALREHTFRELAKSDKPCLVIGTRSALFLPLPRLGAVVLDEEHDASFKQDEGLTYQAKEVAWFRVEQARALLVLGSATPDVKTFFAARESLIPMSVLPGRVGGGTPPEIQLVNIRNEDLSQSLLASETLAALGEVVQRGEQAVILLNRRGYAPLMYCLDCGKAARCPNCDIGLTYHKGRERLVCHYCGYSVPFPCICPTCKGLHYHPMGQGTERLEEQLAAFLPPHSRVLRLDRDSTRCPGRLEAILADFAAGKAQVLVGTQMLSKGHHFPDVTLSVVADGDLGLNLPDYRAAERTFQLLVQSAGRAGRGTKPGKVFIQTRDEGHYCWNFIRTGNYEGFYEHEIELRRRRRYPPFVRLALVRFSFSTQWKEGETAVEDVVRELRASARERGVSVLGPAPAPLALLRGRRRFQCLLKARDWPSVRAVCAAPLSGPFPGDLRIHLDLDPVNML